MKNHYDLKKKTRDIKGAGVNIDYKMSCTFIEEIR